MSPRRHTHSTTLTDEQVNSYKPEESAYLESTIGVTSLSGDTRDKSFIAPEHIPPQYMVRPQGFHSLPKYLHDEPHSLAHNGGHAYPVPPPQPGHNFTIPRQAARTRQERTVEVGTLVPSPPGYQPKITVSPVTWTEKHQTRPSGYSIKQNRVNTPEDERKALTGCSRCCIYFLAITAQTFLHASLALIIYWIIQYRWDGQGLPFSWSEANLSEEDEEQEDAADKVWNFHPVLMVGGLVYCMGQGLLSNWSSFCCHPICSQLLYILFHLLGLPCAFLGLLTVWLWREREGGLHLTTIHSWLGLVTMALALIQFCLGLLRCLLLLCCKSTSITIRNSVDPIHSNLGTTAFILAIATAIAGITESVGKMRSLSSSPESPTEVESMGEEEIFLNSVGVVLIVLAVVVPLVVTCQSRRGSNKVGDVGS